MTYQTDMGSIIAIVKEAVAFALNENESYLAIEIHELSNTNECIMVSGAFKVVPFFTTRTGKIEVTLQKNGIKLEIISLKVKEDKG